MQGLYHRGNADVSTKESEVEDAVLIAWSSVARRDYECKDPDHGAARECVSLHPAEACILGPLNAA